MDATRFDDIPGIECWPIDARLHVEIARDPVPDAAPADSPIAREWQRLQALNPRIFDGTLLSVRGFDPASQHILAKRERYQRLAVQPAVNTGVRLLGVTAIIVRRDGPVRVLLGRRGASVRDYPGLWEFGPSGGVVAPPLSIQRLETPHLRAHLEDEVTEELGPGADVHAATPVMLIRDAAARSDDVCFLMQLASDFTHEPNWEYSDIAWVEVGDLPRFEHAEDKNIIPPTRALMRLLEWHKLEDN